MRTSRGPVILASLVLALTLAAAGCGGGSDNGSSSSSSAQSTATQTGGGKAAASASAGKSVFTSNCKSCHVLKDANATGTVGPDLDDVKPDEATVKTQVVNGGGPMPAFGKQGILTAKQIDDVAAYVSSVAGNG